MCDSVSMRGSQSTDQALTDRKQPVLRSRLSVAGHLRAKTETEQKSGAAETDPVQKSKK